MSNLTQAQKEESAVQAVVALAQELRPWSEEFRGRLALIMAGFGKGVAGGDALDVLRAGYLRVCTNRFGKLASEQIEAALRDAEQEHGGRV